MREAQAWPSVEAKPLSAVVSMMWLAACEGPQSALSPGGSNAQAIFDISLVLFVGAAITFVGVMALALYAVVARPERFPGARSWVLGGGIIFPIVTLTALQVHEFSIARRLAAQGGPDKLRVEVTGHMWWWEVRYPDAGPEGSGGLHTANEIVIPVGRPVEFLVTTADVIHSFWIPSLAGKIDMIPGHVNRLTVTAERPGVYRGQCAEYCGAQHALMAFAIVAESPERFDAWLLEQVQPAPQLADGLSVAGQTAFLSLGCGACHTIRGTPAQGVIGPDLTHVGSRLTLAAGSFPNNVGTLADWISSSQHLKPENHMPSFDIVDAPTLHAIAAWLEGLK